MNNSLNLIFLICFATLGSVGIALWAALIARKSKGRDLLGWFGGRELIGSPYGFIDVLLVFFAWMGGQVIAVGVAMVLLGISHEDISTISGEQEAKLIGLVGLAQLIGVFLAWGVLYARYGRSGGSQAIGVQPKNIAKDIVLGLAAFAMVIPIVLLIQWLLTLLLEYEHPSLEMLTRDASWLTFVLVWFVAGFVAPICEEIFFRGTLQAWLQRLGPGRMKSDQILVGGWDSGVSESGKLGRSKHAQPNSDSLGENDSDADLNPYRSPRDPAISGQSESESGLLAGAETDPRSWITQSHWPIYVTSAIFAGLHIGQGAAPIPLFVLSVALGYLYRKTESILPCIVLHMLLNTFSLFWFTVNLFFGAEPSL